MPVFSSLRGLVYREVWFGEEPLALLYADALV
jgi:hypothetical protein